MALRAKGDVDARDLYGDIREVGRAGGFNTTLLLESCRGRRALDAAGIGAWLTIGAEFSKKSSWNMCSGSFDAIKRDCLAISARSGVTAIPSAVEAWSTRRSLEVQSVSTRARRAKSFGVPAG